MRSFGDVFGYQAEAVARAPGRVNLLGEHTDYNQGYVLPTAIPQYTTVQVARSQDERYHAYAAAFDNVITFDPWAQSAQGYSSYLIGCIRLLQAHFVVPPVALHISSDIPIGVGLSSSAALEVAVLRALRELFKIGVADIELARLAQQAEVRFALVNCGIMDQMAVTFATTQHMLFLDTRSLAFRLLPLPSGVELLVVDSGISRTLAESIYNLRRVECDTAAKRLDVAALRDISDETVADALPYPLNRRARHVITENKRVMEAASGVSAERFGALMSASHASLRDQFEVSTGALDVLVDLLHRHTAVYGAKLTGAGFGGACVALTQRASSRTVGSDVIARYSERGYRGGVLVAFG